MARRESARTPPTVKAVTSIGINIVDHETEQGLFNFGQSNQLTNVLRSNQVVPDHRATTSQSRNEVCEKIDAVEAGLTYHRKKNSEEIELKLRDFVMSAPQSVESNTNKDAFMRSSSIVTANFNRSQSKQMVSRSSSKRNDGAI